MVRVSAAATPELMTASWAHHWHSAPAARQGRWEFGCMPQHETFGRLPLPLGCGRPHQLQNAPKQKRSFGHKAERGKCGERAVASATAKILRKSPQHVTRAGMSPQQPHPNTVIPLSTPSRHAHTVPSCPKSHTTKRHGSIQLEAGPGGLAMWLTVGLVMRGSICWRFTRNHTSHWQRLPSGLQSPAASTHAHRAWLMACWFQLNMEAWRSFRAGLLRQHASPIRLWDEAYQLSRRPGPPGPPTTLCVTI